MEMVTTMDRVGLALPEDMTFEAWVTLGRSLAAEDRSLRWMIGDWISEGRTRFADQVDFDFLGQSLGVEPKQLKQDAKVAEAFPPALRCTDLPFEVHAYLAALPEERRLEKLKQARTEGWGAKQARTAVTQHRQQEAMFEDNDPERLATLIYRAWNNAGPEIREHAWPILMAAAKNGFGIADEEVVVA